MIADPILGSFQALVAARSERVLVVCTGRSATIGDVDGLARAMQMTLGARPMEPGTPVGLSAPNGPAFLAGFLALRRLGLAVLPLEAAAPDAERRRAAAGLGAEAILTCYTGWPNGGADWTVDVLSPEKPRRLPEAAVVKLTSGSTGTPRGVVTSADNLCADDDALWRVMGLTDDDRIVAAVPLGHSYGLSSIALPALRRGVLLAVPDGSGPLAALVAAESARATFLPTAPAYLQALLGLSSPPALPRSVRLVISAGARLAPATASAFGRAYGQCVHVFYGASECGGIAYDVDGHAAERGTVGRPVPGVEVRLEQRAGLAEGEGVVTVRSRSVAVSYLPDPDEALAGGRFETSDRGAWVDGELALLGRMDDQINVKGKKVDPREIEHVLSQLAGVVEVAVVGVPSRLDGSQDVQVIVACPTGGLAAEDIITFCRGRMAEHKVPRRVRIVAALPRTERGKIDRRALLAPDGEESPIE